MMTFCFRDSAYGVYESERLSKISEGERARNTFSILGKRPAVQFPQEHLGFYLIERCYPAFTGNAFLCSEIHAFILPGGMMHKMNLAHIRATCLSMGEALLDIVMPARERTVRLRGRSATDASPSPRSQPLLGVRITTLMPYHGTLAEDAIRALKYDGNPKAAQLLADILADYLEEEIANLHAFSARPVVLVPVPLHKKRQRERGFNQIEKVFAKLPAGFHDGSLAHIEMRALFRTRATPAQTKLHRSERLRNVRGAFSADERVVRGMRCIVVDDVCTTGSTLAECTRTLERAGAKVTAIGLARA